MKVCDLCGRSEWNGSLFVVKRIALMENIEIRSWGHGDSYICEKCIETIAQFGNTIEVLNRFPGLKS